MIRVLSRLSGTGLFAIVVGVAVIIVLVFLVTTGGFDLSGSDEDDPLAIDEQASEEPAGAQTSDAQPLAGAPPATVSQDDAFQFGALRMAVTDIRLSKTVSEGRDAQEAIEQFATLRLTARNTGAAPTSLAGRLLLLDGEGRTFSPDAAATAATALRDESRRDALATELQPGINSDLIVVFQVPDEAANFRLRLLGGYIEIQLDR